MKAEIIAVGSELLVGGRSETNSIFLSDLLAREGIEVRQKTVVGDNLDDLCRVITQAVKRVPLLILTGGLGPTMDDLTREALSKVTGHPLRLRTQALRSINARLRRAKRTLSSNQRRQAFFPSGAVILENSVGTAPGFFMIWKRCRIFCLPGVSHEAKRMFETAVIPILKKEGIVGEGIERRTIHTFGLIEGVVDQRLKGIVPPRSGISMGILASPLGVSITLRATMDGKSLKGGEKSLLEVYLKKISSKLGDVVYGYDDQTMEQIVGERLHANDLHLSVAESCTGGLIAHRLTQVPGSSAYFERGAICYSNQAKIDWLAVAKRTLEKYGAVSAQTAKAMAKGIRERSGTDVGLSVTGIAGPTGGTPQKPVGLVYVGLATATKIFAKEFRFHGDRDMIKLRASQAALDLLRRWLCGLSLLDS